MPKNIFFLVRTVVLALLASGFASCVNQPPGSRDSFSARTYPVPARYGSSAPVTASPFTTDPQKVAAPQRKPGLLARIFKRNDDEQSRSRPRMFGGSGRIFPRFLERTKPQPVPQRPTIPSTIVKQEVLAQSNKSNTRVVIDVGRQKAFLLVNDTVALEAPVSTARPGKSTPRGSFRMTERVRTGKVSTIYDVSMPYWMRLDGSLYGVHAGYLPGYPASAGCIRLPNEAAQIIFDNTRGGTRVNIYSSWTEMGG